MTFPRPTSDTVAAIRAFLADPRFASASTLAAVGMAVSAQLIGVVEQHPHPGRDRRDMQAGKQDGETGGLAYLNELAGCVSSPRNTRRHAEIVAERATLRATLGARSHWAFWRKPRALAEFQPAAPALQPETP